MGLTETLRLSVITLLVFIIVLVMAAFNEVPVSQEVPVGSEAVFRCQHLTADIVRWRVNGTFLGRNPPPDITPGTTRDDSGNLVDTLTIVARVEYNRTTIVCVAEFDDGTPDETSDPPAMLLIQGTFTEVPVSQTVFVGDIAMFRSRHSMTDNIEWIINGTKLTTSIPGIVPGMMQESGTMVNTLNITGQQEYNTTSVVARAKLPGDSSEDTQPAMLQVAVFVDFVEVPRSLKVAVGVEAVFQCCHSSAVAIGWKVNGTALTPQQNFGFEPQTVDGVHTLTTTADALYNSSAIQCVALFLGDLPDRDSPAAVFKIQGPLEAVTTLTKVNTTISWEPPFSLDLTDIDPDIVYCVDVYNITCGARDLVTSDCSVTDTSYTALSDGYLYEYTVTPRSNVEGAENGTASQPLKDVLPTFTLSSSQLSLGTSESLRNYQIELSYTRAPTIPSSYTLSLEALDGLGNLDHVEATATERQTNLVLSVTGLESRRLWSATILAFGCEEHSVLSTLVGTHDFQDTSISSPSAGAVRVTGTFVEGSLATGVLVIVSGDSEVTYHFSSRDGSDNHEVTIPGLAGGEYAVSVFVLEENRLPFERTATVLGKAFVTEDTAEPPPPTIEYSVRSTSTGVCVQCNFLATDTSECTAVVHGDLMNIESSHKFTRSGDTASGCIEGVNLVDYQVGVVGARQLKSGPAGSSNLIPIVIGVLIVAVSTLTVIVIVLLIIVRVHYRKYRNQPRPGDEEKQQNYYTTRPSAPAPPTENPRAQLVVPTVEMSVGIYDTVRNEPSNLSPSSSSSDSSQASTVSTSVSESTAGNESSPHYSELAVQTLSIHVPPFADSRVAYSDVVKTQGASDQLYTMVNPKKATRETYPDDLTKVVYSDIRPHVVGQPPQETSAENALTAPPSTPVTVENVVKALLPVASKWRSIGEAFPLSEKRLDDIETTEGDEQCLQEMVGAYMLRQDLNHTWDEIVNALKKIQGDSLAEVDSLADKIFKVHVAPYVLTLPNQPHATESNMYKHKVSTDGDSHDTSSPVLLLQQTEPATSECEVNSSQDKQTTGDVQQTPSHGDNKRFNKTNRCRNKPERRIVPDGESTETENNNTKDAQEMKCKSDESDSGVSEDDDIQTYSSDQEKAFSGVSHESGSEDTSQPGGRTGPPTVQLALPSQGSNYMPQQELMEPANGNDLVPLSSPRAVKETSSVYQEKQPHDHYFAALAHQNGKRYLPRETCSLKEYNMLGTFTPVELLDEPNEEADALDIVDDAWDHVAVGMVKCAPKLAVLNATCTVVNIPTLAKRGVTYVSETSCVPSVLYEMHKLKSKKNARCSKSKKHVRCSYLPRMYVQTNRAPSKRATTPSGDLQSSRSTPTITCVEWPRFLQLINNGSCIHECDSTSPSRSPYLGSPFPV